MTVNLSAVTCVTLRHVASWLLRIAVLLVLLGADLISATVFLNKWAVEIKGGFHEANNVAAENGFRNLGQIGSLENFYLFEQRRLVKRSTNPSRRHHVRLEHEPRVRWVEQQTVRRRVKRAINKAEYWKLMWNDPLWPRMWYLNRGLRGGVDMNVIGAWELGYSGRGVVVTILDDGIEHNHTDLHQNYDPDASYDINGFDRDPMPRYDSSDDNRHGTRCAGQVAAVANNKKCTIGVAYNAHIGGIRMLDGDVSDFVEAQALSFNPQHIDIYSASWGPEDNGRVIEGPAKLATQAFSQGILSGRGGRGSIYIWASGNGGSRSDSCSCDGYTNSIYTLSVSSTSEHGTRPWYLEECPSTLAATYSSGENYRERKILTTDLHNTCTEDHTGTSASAPLAAGMCALALEANPDLTWRDMQHIVIMSTRTQPLQDAQWVVNGVGRKVSHRYGYGLMDAKAMVELAERWTTVPTQYKCTTKVVNITRNIEKFGAKFEITTDGCAGLENEINFVEHVQARVSLSYSKRGDLQLNLTSPSGTRSTLLPRRKDDYQPGKLDGWPFLSVFYWGEHPNGTWTLNIENVGSELNAGRFDEWQLIFYGTRVAPINLTDVPRRRSQWWNATTTTPVKTESSVTTMAHMASSINSTYSSAGKLTTVDVTTSTLQEITTKTPTAAIDVSSTKNLTIKDSSIENATELKPVARQNATFPVFPPVIAGAETNDTTFSAEKNTSNLQIINSTFNLSQTMDSTLNCLSGAAPSSDCLTAAMDSVTVMSTPVNMTTTADQTTVAIVTEQEVVPVCHDECMADGCTGPLATDCHNCINARLPETRECVPYCPPSTYQQQSTNLCEACPALCLDCMAIIYTEEIMILNCLSCVAGHYLVTLGNITACAEQCPQQHYADEVSGYCEACSFECLHCSGSPSHCLECNEGFELLGSSCVVPCSFSEFRADDGSCQPCDVSCSICVGPEVGDCVECTDGWWWENGVCTANCSEGYYGTVFDGDRICHMCHPSCMTCFGPGESDCYSCFHPLKLVGTVCHETCTPGHYESEDEVCLPCHLNCKTCRGPEENDCLTCHYSLFYMKGQCIEACPAGFFESQMVSLPSRPSLTRDLDSISSGDIASQGSQDDFSNEISAPGDVQITGEGEVPERPGSGVPDRPGAARTVWSEVVIAPMVHKWQQCEPCHASCASCIGELPSDCVTCHHGLVLSAGHCALHCNSGEYLSNGYCLQCHESCLSCDGPSDSQCTSCQVGTYLHHGSCTVSCPDGFYHRPFTCLPCRPDCDTCNDTGDCMSCVAPRVLNAGRCVTCCQDQPVLTDDCCLCTDDGDACVIISTSESTTSADSTTHPTFAADVGVTGDDAIIPPGPPAASVESPVGTTLTGKSDNVSRSQEESPPSLIVVTLPVPLLPGSTPPPSALPDMHSDSSEDDFVTPEPGLTDLTFTAVPPSSVDVIYERITSPATSVEVISTSHHQSSSSAPVSDNETPNFFGPPPLWMSLLAVGLCVGALVALFVVVAICLCRARSHHKLCWAKHRCYLPVPLFYQNGTNTVAVDVQAQAAPAKSPELTPLTHV